MAHLRPGPDRLLRHSLWRSLIPGKLLDPASFPKLSPFLLDHYGTKSYIMRVAHLDAGILVVLAISGIGILGTMLAGWSSNNKFSLMGAARAASQMISYEVSMGLALISLVVTYGTLDLNEMVIWHQASYLTSSPPGALSRSLWPSSCFWPPQSLKTNASPSTFRNANPNWSQVTSPNTPP